MHDDGMMAKAIFARTASCCMHGNEKVQETSLFVMQIRPNVRNRTLTFFPRSVARFMASFLPNLCDSFLKTFSLQTSIKMNLGRKIPGTHLDSRQRQGHKIV